MANKSRMDEPTFIAEDVNRTSLNFFEILKSLCLDQYLQVFWKTKKIHNYQLLKFLDWQVWGENYITIPRAMLSHYNATAVENVLTLISNAPLLCPWNRRKP